MTDSNGVAMIPMLSNIITSQRNEFVGNYKVIAHYQNYTTAKKGEMRNNNDISLDFTDLSIEPPDNIIISILVYVIVLIAAVSFITLWLRKYKPSTDKDKLEISKQVKSKPSTATPIYNLEEVGKYAECPYCGSNIRDTFYEHGGIVRCNKCGAFHHRDCFEYYGKKCGSSSCKLKEA